MGLIHQPACTENEDALSQNTGDMSVLLARQIAQKIRHSLRSEGVNLDTATLAGLEETIQQNYSRLGSDLMPQLSSDVIDRSIDRFIHELFRLRLELNQNLVDNALAQAALAKLCPSWPFCG